jgi:hypothetical protein
METLDLREAAVFLHMHPEEAAGADVEELQLENIDCSARSASSGHEYNKLLR